MVLDPRKRALEALALGGAVPFTGEVDVETVPVDLGMESPSVRNATKAPVPQALTTGDPQNASERDYYADALSEKHRRQFEQSLTGIGSGILEAFTGVGPSQESLRQSQEYAEEPLVTYLQKQKEADSAREASLQQARLAPKPGQRQKSTDPSSPESKRAQGIVAGILGDHFTPEQIALMSEDDLDSVLKYGTPAAQREVQREGEVGKQKRFSAQQEQQGEQFAEMMGYRWADMSQEERLALMRRADDLKKQETEAVGKQTEQATGLRKEFEGHQTVKDYRSTKVSLDKLRNAAKDPSAAGDLALIFSYMKILDPGSVVKETEFANAQNAAGVPERIRNAWNKALSGERLAPNQRKDFIRSAERLFSAQESAYNELASQYEELAPEGRGGEVVLPPKPKTAQRKPAAAVLPKDASGQPTLDAPRPRRKRDKTGQLWEEQPDGSAKKVPG